ncbi:hypothetical protein BD560DRAFT_435888 [Blakeslea trispora]|nr:hypothetical protein BD560DRAFT_435888 [Blakeslea trispora]
MSEARTEQMGNLKFAEISFQRDDNAMDDFLEKGLLLGILPCRALASDMSVVNIRLSNLPFLVEKELTYEFNGYVAFHVTNEDDKENKLIHSIPWKGGQDDQFYAVWKQMPKYCKYCHKEGHSMTDCETKKKKQICWSCDENGHITAIYPRRNASKKPKLSLGRSAKRHRASLGHPGPLPPSDSKPTETVSDVLPTQTLAKLAPPMSKHQNKEMSHPIAPCQTLVDVRNREYPAAVFDLVSSKTSTSPSHPLQENPSSSPLDIYEYAFDLHELPTFCRNAFTSSTMDYIFASNDLHQSVVEASYQDCLLQYLSSFLSDASNSGCTPQEQWDMIKAYIKRVTKRFSLQLAAKRKHELKQLMKEWNSFLRSKP